MLRRSSICAAAQSGRDTRGFLSMIRSLIAWNRTNAASTRAAAEGGSDRTGGEAPAAFRDTAGASDSPSSPFVTTNAAAAASSLDVVETMVRSRWSCKRFDPARPIDEATLRRVLEAMTRAPTGYNLQGWHAIVVTDAGQKSLLHQAVLGQQQILDAAATVVFAADMEPERNAPQALELGLETGYYGPMYGPTYLRNIFYFLHGGPLQTMAAAKSSLSAWYSSATGTPLLSVPVSRAGYAWKQCTFPADTFLHLCTAAGWNTCVMEGLDEGAVRRVVGLPERYSIPMVISVGYATREAMENRVPSPRFACSHLIRWNRY